MPFKDGFYHRNMVENFDRLKWNTDEIKNKDACHRPSTDRPGLIALRLAKKEVEKTM